MDDEHLDKEDGFNGISRFTCYRPSYIVDEWENKKIVREWKILTEKEDYFAFLVYVNKIFKEKEQLTHDATVLIQSNQEYRKENTELRERVNVLEDQITAQGIVIKGYQDRNMKLFNEKEALINGIQGNEPFKNEIHRIIRDGTEIACADTMDDAEIIVDLLNRQRTIIDIERRTRQAMSDNLKEEIDKSDGELRNALVRVLNSRLDIKH